MSEVWTRGNHRTARSPKFFLISTCHDSLLNMLEMNFALMQHHQYSLGDIEGMLPWERRVYIELLIQHLKEEKERMEAEKANRA